MSTHKEQFQSRLSFFENSNLLRSLVEIRRGVEREALRVNPNGHLAQTSHPASLGSALTHEIITTDFSEALLEFITPPETSIKTTLSQLADIHKYVQTSIADERLWPLSMPCFIDPETKIPIARYGKSNIGRMKEVYRKGLHHRYGSMMQVISGVHFNWSLPDSFWVGWCSANHVKKNKQTVSEYYFDLVRNFKRLAWLISYLFGASPALCKSFLAGKEQVFDFKQLGKGTLYLPFATSLRMSDLGYTNAEQSSLNICYDSLDSYVDSVRKAINTQSSKYLDFPSGQAGDWQQLNTNILQIENELYSPIRPKQVAKPLEKPTDALSSRGVSYIEVRALDVNPFSSIGIKSEQFYFLDVFLLYCLVTPSPRATRSSYIEFNDNLNAAVLEGRKPGLMLSKSGKQISLVNWANDIFRDLDELAKVFDVAFDTEKYSDAVRNQRIKINDPDNTPSAMWLNELLNSNSDNSIKGLEKAQRYKQHALDFDYIFMDELAFQEQVVASIEARNKIELGDTQDFSSFIADYFSQPTKY